MENVILVVHLFLALAIIGLVLMQRSEGGGLGIGGNSGGAGGLASPRGTANFLTRATAICAASFFVTSLVLGVMAGAHTSANKGILENLQVPAAVEAPIAADAAQDQTTSEEAAPAAQTEESNELPSAPIAE